MNAAVIGLLAWLTVEDIRHRRLPHWGTTVPLVLIGVTALVAGIGGLLGVGNAFWGNAWDKLALGLAFAAVMLSDRWMALLPASLALGAAFGGGTEIGQTAATGWLLALGLAKAGIVGAGDAKVAMVVLACIPDPVLGICILAACGLAGGILLARRMGLASVPLIRAVVRDMLAGKVPARTGERGVAVVPLVPVMAVGVLVYLWPLQWLGVG
jgi:Flp pilus assembly protein protease CpaA